MSTHSAIARPIGDGWEGVYCHYDGYPTHQGPKVWEVLTQHGFDGDKAARWAIDAHPYGWSSFGVDGRADTAENGGSNGLFREVGPCSEECGANHLEWVWIIGPERLTVLVRAPFLSGPGTPSGGWTTRYSDHSESEPTYVNRHVYVGGYPYAKGEPDWEEVQAVGDKIREAAWAKIKAATIVSYPKPTRRERAYA